MRRFYSPLRYPGGKNCIYNFVSKLLNENNLIGSSYAEPYAGGAGLAVRLLFNGLVNHIHINDYDISIYAFWTSILNKPDEFCKWIENVEITMDNWFKYRDIYRSYKKGSDDIFTLAQATFFLNRTNVSGVIKGGVIGGFKQEGKDKLTARFKKIDLINRILEIAKFRKHITVTNLDGINFVKKINRNKHNTFIYLDPPYFKKGSELYMNYFSEKDHSQLAQFVQQMNKPWIVSYDNHQFIINLYQTRNKILYKLSQNTSNRIGNEIIVFSDLINFNTSLDKLKQPQIIT